MGASNAEPAAPIRAHAGDVIPLVANASRRGADRPRKDAQQRRLPCAVGADDADRLARRELKVNTVQNHQRAKALRDAAGLEQRG